MKKILIVLSSTAPTVANCSPIGGAESDPTFNLVAWNLTANLQDNDEAVLFVQNQTPEQGGVAESAGYNYVIFRKKNTLTFNTGSDTGTFVVGETVTGGTSSATGVISAVDQTAGTLTLVNVDGTFRVGETLTGGTSGGTLVLTTSVPATTYVYATSLKNHPYRTVSANDSTPLKINADVIDLETCVTAYGNALYHTA